MEPPSLPRIEIVERTIIRSDHDLLRLGIAATLADEGYRPEEVNLLLTDETEVRNLNRRFRDLNEPTDVLTFPADEEANGDIAIAVDYAARQAEKRGVPLDTELAYLAIHGALHLCGLDDETEDEADEMRRRMSRIAVRIGLPPDDSWGSLLHETVLC